MSDNRWEELYQKGETQWDKGEPSPGLVDFLHSSTPLRKGTVVVPGCGTGHDVRAWAKAGFEATGLDLATTAIQLAREKTRAAGLTANFAQTNFLTTDPEQKFDYVFEHTLFCAIQPSERPLYVEAVHRWLKPGGRYVAVFYMIDDVDGPPFGTTREEIKQRFSPRFTLLKDWVPRSYPGREGLEWMTVWQPE